MTIKKVYKYKSEISPMVEMTAVLKTDYLLKIKI